MFAVVPIKRKVFRQHTEGMEEGSQCGLSNSQSRIPPLKCTGCKKRIRSRYYVTFVEDPWHEKCLTCDVCDEILFSFGSGKCYCRNGNKLCQMDYV